MGYYTNHPEHDARPPSKAGKFMMAISVCLMALGAVAYLLIIASIIKAVINLF